MRVPCVERRQDRLVCPGVNPDQLESRQLSSADERAVAIIQEYRKRGLFVIGLGLDLNEREAKGLDNLFGTEAVRATRAKFARSLATVVSAAIARGVR